ncbi:MAG: tRNA (guanosine(46)-N7)-methyltransferase TrmB [Candidatus Thioglobus sp.]|uniref:tRNA (guanosine(46)-N7)-methyltransferase TrmB n=1 Tax=Candidatus Thioglobus sp. TaxID=2026721 RepID=UPI0026268E66|nr:tRNA (guanosine(46)-N7)-methyltransferase TrmB [Candidatus Thioglobus sp.]MDC9727051.1 tRNA (guanosine(46)-N7)-methyltransferase TrmB [Candidatus Thioglobus sp.]
MRKIQSFVKRSGRLTEGQKSGLNELWSDFGIDLPEGKIDLTSLFTKQQPTVLEIGFGNGDSLLQMAINEPQRNFLGIEVYEAGVGRLINEAYKHQLTNLKIIKEDAVEVLKNNIADNSLAGFQLYFADPWHKKKHHKRRIVQNEFMDAISEKLVNGGFVHMATDWEHYAEQMMETLEAHAHFKNTTTAHNYLPRPERRPITKFERRGQRLGHGVWDMIFNCEK